MKKTFIYILFFILGYANLLAQPYGNEWIDYSKTYYKFTVNTDGICRINYSNLISAGINASILKGSDIKLYRQGVEIPVYVSTLGQFSTNDFIEFYGERNDGTLDASLYKNPFTDQPHDRQSMFNNNAAYFLTIDPFVVNSRITDVVNDTTVHPTKELYCYTTEEKFSTTRNDGVLAYASISDLYNSDFDKGEGFMNGLSGGYTISTNNAFYQTGLTARLKLNFFSNNVNHSVLVKVGNTFQYTDNFFGQQVRKLDVSFDASTLSTTGNTNISTTTQLSGESLVPIAVQLTYPCNFNFKNRSLFKFSIDKTNAVFFEITNFNNSGLKPILYDLDNKLRYEGLIQGSSIVFNLPATTLPKSNLILSTSDITQINYITSITARNFTDFSALNNQGDYLIISNTTFNSSTDGTNYLQEYKNYRNSVQGGSYKANIYYIDQLNDQFIYGIGQHPLAIRNFVNYAIDNFSINPKMVFIIGKGSDYQTGAYKYVQTYGTPASDNLLVARSAIQNTPQLGIGRLSVITNGDKIKTYLEKVKEYEATQQDTLPSDMIPADKSWMKSVLHLGGGFSNFEQDVFKAYLNGYKATIEAAKYGGRVYSLFKTSSNPVEIAQSIFIDSIINNGVSLITFFGHSATSTLDFSLLPESYTNKGKYHLLLSNGCFVGNVFGYSANSYSERFVLTPDKGAIGFIAPIYLAIASTLNNYTTNFYNNLSYNHYNEPIGNVLKAAAAKVIGLPSNPLDPMMGEQMIFHGDPALKINTFSKPDYYIDASSISFNPFSPNVSNDSFQININILNLGAAVNDYFTVNVDRIFPNGTIRSYSVRIPSTIREETVSIWIPTDQFIGAGINTFTIKVDYGEEIEEYSEFNNQVTITKIISADDIIPIFPYEFCIVNNPNFKLTFNTADNFAPNRQYIFQIDTTEFFNSPLLVTERVNAPGAVITWDPNIPHLEDKVYYWRGSLDTIYNNPLNWRNSSFIYNTGLSSGWNQSHYFQYLKDKFVTLQLPNDRTFKYPNTFRSLKVHNGIISDQAIESYFDNFLIGRNSCDRKSFIMFVYDVNTNQNWQSYQVGNTGYGTYGDRNCVNNSIPLNIAEFPTRYNDPLQGAARRQVFINFLNSIPDNAFVMGYSFFNAGYSQWQNDQSILGTTLFDAFENLGVTQIRDQQDNVPFVFFLQKNNPAFTPIQIKRPSSEGVIDTTFIFTGNWTNGVMQSPLIGPAKNWKEVLFDWHALETPSNDLSTVDVIAIDTNGNRTTIYNNMPVSPLSLMDIDAKQYPYMQMEWNSTDNTNSTSPQLDYWRITYDKVPEAVVNPSITFQASADSVSMGDNYTATVAVQNITPLNMDSLLVKFTIINANNNTYEFYDRVAPLPGMTSLDIVFNYNFPTPFYFGLNRVIVEVNPNNDQIEQFHFNNFAEFLIFVDKDNINPLLDVTFDGRHITDNEYVAATPEILFRLKDENKQLALNDTNGFTIFLKDLSNPLNPIQITGSTAGVTFIPADPNQIATNNEARLYYKPTLADGNYELIAQGTDRSANNAGKYDYSIKFKVDGKPSITNLLNYPNPFSTTTKFVFTITGNEVPNNFRIQIYSVSGKMVKEISRAELGNIHIGTNITDYAWDGTDTYGDKLANGVYFYKVIAKSNDGSSIELRPTAADKYFENGYGKLYIAR